jgi:hypothetical protein
MVYYVRISDWLPYSFQLEKPEPGEPVEIAAHEAEVEQTPVSLVCYSVDCETQMSTTARTCSTPPNRKHAHSMTWAVTHLETLTATCCIRASVRVEWRSLND